MKKYTEPEILITKVFKNDIITASLGLETPPIDEEGDGWAIGLELD